MSTIGQAGDQPPHELLPGQRAIHDFCSELLPITPSERMNDGRTIGWKTTVWSMINPSHVQEQLRASAVGDLMLQDGASLSITGAVPQATGVDAEERLRSMWLGEDESTDELVEEIPEHNANRLGMPELDLFVGKASLTGAGVKVRSLALATTKEDAATLDTPQWTDEVSILIEYQKGRYSARQSMSAQTCSYWTNGSRVLIERNVASPFYYGGVDYKGHLPASRWCRNQSEVLGLVALARKLVDEPLRVPSI